MAGTEEGRAGESVLKTRENVRPPQHIRHNEKPDMAAPNVDLIKMTDSAVARRHGDVFELDVHIVFGYGKVSASVRRAS